MRITILTAGSRGDVQPYVALGLGLQKAGYVVRLATHANFEPMIREYNLEFARLEGDPQAYIQGEVGLDWLESGRNPFGFMRGFQRLLTPIMREAFEDAWAACQDAGAILVSGLGYYPGTSIAEKLGLPLLQAYLQPVHPTSVFPSPVFPIPLKGHKSYNFLTHFLGGQLFWNVLRPGLNAVRQELLDLPPLPWLGVRSFVELEQRKMPVAYGYSPIVLPRPRNWGDWIHVVGYWFLEDHSWQPPSALVDFLAGGPAPVYVGFGSMVERYPERMAAMFLDALKHSGQRAILLTGWGGLQQSDLPEWAFKLESAPHDWLFPRMAAIVHHGGAGTTALALRAGVPSIVMPFFGDQFFWGQTITRLGVSPGPVYRREMSVQSLTDAIRTAVGDSGMRLRAEALGARIREEDGIGYAVALFREFLEAAGG